MEFAVVCCSRSVCEFAGCLFDVWVCYGSGAVLFVCVSGLLTHGCEMPCAHLMWFGLICVWSLFEERKPVCMTKPVCV